jgi:hypothetical protein
MATSRDNEVRRLAGELNAALADLADTVAALSVLLTTPDDDPPAQAPERQVTPA